MTILLVLLFGYSSFSSGSGTFNLYSARTLQKANLAFNLHFSYSRTPYISGLYHHVGQSKIGLTYGIIDYLELYLGTTIYGKAEQGQSIFSPEEYMFGDKDIYGGFKFHYPVIKGDEKAVKWLVGGILGTKITPFHADRDDEFTINQHFEPTLKHGPDIHFGLLNDVELYPLLLHLNLGYNLRGDISDTPLQDSLPGAYFLQQEREDLFSWGFGFEIVANPFLRFILETKGINPLNNGSDTLLASLGLRFIAPDVFTFDIAVDYAFNEDVDFVHDWIDVNTSNVDDMGKWRFKLGFSTKSALIEREKKEKPKEGIIALTVNDIETNEPLDALISFKDTTVGIYRSGENGKVKIKLKPGIYNIRISKEGYVPREASVTVKHESEVSINTVLRKKKEPKGVFTGTITSYREKTPISASVEFLGTDINPAVSDPEKGVFKTELPAGTYNMKVSADGYLPKTFPMEIKEGETTVKNIELVEKLEEEKKLVLRGINFASGKAVIPPDGYPILDRVIEVLKANKDVKVEISGHTDAVGSASYNQKLSEARAQSVRQYLINHGIESVRLIARGYGEAKPIAPNTTREGRAQNRRIEFTVLSQ